MASLSAILRGIADVFDAHGSTGLGVVSYDRIMGKLGEAINAEKMLISSPANTSASPIQRETSTKTMEEARREAGEKLHEERISVTSAITPKTPISLRIGAKRESTSVTDRIGIKKESPGITEQLEKAVVTPE